MAKPVRGGLLTLTRLSILHELDRFDGLLFLQHAFGCEEGFKDTKWWLGFSQGRIKDIDAWSRMFGFFVITASVLVDLGTKLLLGNVSRAKDLLRRVASRRKDRWDLSMFTAMLKLVQQDCSLLMELSAQVKLKLESRLPNVS